MFKYTVICSAYYMCLKRVFKNMLNIVASFQWQGEILIPQWQFKNSKVENYYV
jgi:hypothetical protein